MFGLPYIFPLFIALPTVLATGSDQGAVGSTNFQNPAASQQSGLTGGGNEGYGRTTGRSISLSSPDLYSGFDSTRDPTRSAVHGEAMGNSRLRDYKMALQDTGYQNRGGKMGGEEGYEHGFHQQQEPAPLSSAVGSTQTGFNEHPFQQSSRLEGGINGGGRYGDESLSLSERNNGMGRDGQIPMSLPARPWHGQSQLQQPIRAMDQRRAGVMGQPQEPAPVYDSVGGTQTVYGGERQSLPDINNGMAREERIAMPMPSMPWQGSSQSHIPIREMDSNKRYLNFDHSTDQQGDLNGQISLDYGQGHSSLATNGPNHDGHGDSTWNNDGRIQHPTSSDIWSTGPSEAAGQQRMIGLPGRSNSYLEGSVQTRVSFVPGPPMINSGGTDTHTLGKTRFPFESAGLPKREENDQFSQGTPSYGEPLTTSESNQHLPVSSDQILPMTTNLNPDDRGRDDELVQPKSITKDKPSIDITPEIQLVSYSVSGQDSTGATIPSNDHSSGSSPIDKEDAKPEEPQSQVHPSYSTSLDDDNPNNWVQHQSPADPMPAKVVVPLTLENGGYFGTVAVGTSKPGLPRQKLKVLFDTASTDIWMLSSEACAKGYCPDGVKAFDGTLSDTYSTDEKPHKNDFNNGATAAGIIARDTVELGEGEDKLIIKGQEFGESTKFKDMFIDYDAIFGLLFLSPPFVIAHPQPALYQMTKQFGRAPVFSFYLNRYNPSDSKLVFGGTEDEFVVEKYTDHPLQKVYFEGKSKYYNGWNVGISGMNIQKGRQDPVQIPLPSHLYGHPEVAEENIVGPDVLIQQLKSKIFNYAGFRFNSDDYTFACPADMMTEVYNVLPDVEIIINQKKYILSAYDYIRAHDGRCQSMFTGRTDYDHILLGRVFMRKYHIRFDHGNKKLQIAEAKQDQSTDVEALRVMRSRGK